MPFGDDQRKKSHEAQAKKMQPRLDKLKKLLPARSKDIIQKHPRIWPDDMRLRRDMARIGAVKEGVFGAWHLPGQTAGVEVGPPEAEAPVKLPAEPTPAEAPTEAPVPPPTGQTAAGLYFDAERELANEAEEAKAPAPAESSGYAQRNEGQTANFGVFYPQTDVKPAKDDSYVEREPEDPAGE